MGQGVETACRDKGGHVGRQTAGRLHRALVVQHRAQAWLDSQASGSPCQESKAGCQEEEWLDLQGETKLLVTDCPGWGQQDSHSSWGNEH